MKRRAFADGYLKQEEMARQAIQPRLPLDVFSFLFAV
jgi:hypothetical protein